MPERKTAYRTGLLVGLLSISSFSLLLSVPEEASAYTQHSPILIDGDGNFTAINGVVGGRGTPSDPYLIEGWEINASGGSGIEIRSTDAHFAIRDVYIHSLTWSGWSIFLDRVTNATLENASILNDLGGIWLRSVAESRIADNYVWSTEFGIQLDSSTNISIDDNTVTSSWCPICVFASTNISVRRNSLSQGLFDGLRLVTTTNSVVRENTVSNSARGISLQSSISVAVHHNNLINNIIQASDDNGPENSWDNGYPSGGNYWDNYTDVDLCSGQSQTICPDPDGIWDNPFIIDSDSQDRFPLTTPWQPDIFPPATESVRINGQVAVTFSFSTPQPLTLTATVNDTATNGSVIQSANYTTEPSGFPGAPMNMTNPPADSAVEDFFSLLSWPLFAGSWQYCVYGTDEAGNGNTTSTVCATLTILDDVPPQVTSVQLVNPTIPAGTPAATLQAVVDDSLTGSSNVTAANYTFGPLNWSSSSPMTLDSPPGDSPLENFTAVVDTSQLAPGSYEYCVYASDVMANANLTGRCTTLSVVDASAPIIANVTVSPPSPELGGTADITADIYDDDSVEAAFLNITYADSGTIPAPFLHNASSGLYEAVVPADQLGRHGFTIEAVDRVGKVGSAASGYDVVDTTPPLVSDLTVTPDPQEYGGWMNATANITDIGGVSDVFANVLAPDGSLLLNESMNSTSPGSYFHNASYAVLGNLTFTLWASDPSGNWATANVTAAMVDTQAPSIQHVPVASSHVGQTIRVSALVRDTASGVGPVILYHRGVGEQDFVALEMSVDPDTGMYFAMAPAQQETGLFSYYLEAVDGAGNVARDPAAGEAAPHETRIVPAETPFPWFWLLIPLLAATLVIAVALARRRREPEAPPPGPSVRLETASEATVCGICLGGIKAGLTVARCTTCEKVFHDSCASRVANCPSCDSEIRMEEAVVVEDEQSSDEGES